MDYLKSMKQFIVVYYLHHYLSICFSYFLRKVHCFSKKSGNSRFCLYFWSRDQSRSLDLANNSPLFLVMCAFPGTVPSVRPGKLLSCPMNWAKSKTALLFCGPSLARMSSQLWLLTRLHEECYQHSRGHGGGGW